VPMYYRGIDDWHTIPLCPIVVRPLHTVTEVPEREVAALNRRRQAVRRFLARLRGGAESGSRTLLRGGLLTAIGGAVAAVPLVARVAFPRLTGLASRAATDLGRRRIRTRLELHRDANGLALHGTMIGRAGWELVAVRAASTVTASFRFDAAAAPAVMESFPFPHELRVTFALSPGRLEVATTMTASGRRAVPVAFGWHPYFVLPGVARERLRLELPDRRRLVLDDRRLPTGEEVVEPAASLRPDRGFDDGYRLGRDRRLGLSGGRRRLSVTLDHHYRCAQVYTPPDSDSIALEPMTVPTDALARGTTPMVVPGERFTARFAVTPT
ncbi:MAG: putative inorganic carbon transporter subunit DabA, partial [Acidimicrobiia bacterium]